MTTQFTLRSALIAIISVLLIGCSSESLQNRQPPQRPRWMLRWRLSSERWRSMIAC